MRSGAYALQHRSSTFRKDFRSQDLAVILQWPALTTTACCCSVPCPVVYLSVRPCCSKAANKSPHSSVGVTSLLRRWQTAGSILRWFVSKTPWPAERQQARKKSSKACEYGFSYVPCALIQVCVLVPLAPIFWRRQLLSAFCVALLNVSWSSSCELLHVMTERLWLNLFAPFSHARKQMMLTPTKSIQRASNKVQNRPEPVCSKNERVLNHKVVLGSSSASISYATVQ